MYMHCIYDMHYDLCVHGDNDTTFREGGMAMVVLPSQTVYCFSYDI